MNVKRSGRVAKALCPFHAEKTPSFTMDPAKQLYYCHGCHKGGDVISFVEQLENLAFVEAVELLARKTGVTIRYEQLSPAERERTKRRSRLIEAHRDAVAFYEVQLRRSKEAEAARAYLNRRRLKPETVEHFRVGWSPSRWDELTKHLRSKGFRDEELTEAGLSIRTERGSLIDRFRGRVMFPIFDLTGEPRAFGARQMEGGEPPKYLNTAETPVYKKGSLLYALNWAKAEVVRAGAAVIVEGFTDVMALHQEGIPLAVATGGTALGVEHFTTLSRFTSRVLIALDADQAGRSAAERAAEQAFLDAQDRNMDLRVLTLPSGQDPADFATTKGGEEFRRLMSETVPIVEYRLSARVSVADLSEPEGRARALRASLPVLAQIRDEVVRREYGRWVADRTGLDYDVVFLEISKALRGSAAPTAAGVRKTSTHVRLEREALKVALQYPSAVEPYMDRIEPQDFSLRAHRDIWVSIRQGVSDPNAMPEDLASVATALAVEPVEGHVSVEEEPPEALVAELFARLEEFALTRQIAEVKARLEKLNPLSDPDAYDRLYKELIALEGAKRRAGSEE
jgi:DNA primase